MTAPILRSPLEGLHDNPERYGFFQAVRLLMLRGPRGERRLRVPPELLRFGSTIHLAFPPNEIDSIGPADADGPRLMRVNFMGLCGPSGALPRHYTEWLIGLRQSRDLAAQDFFDLFNHRLIALFWQAWARHRPELAVEFDAGGGLQRHVYDLVGMGTPKLYGGLGLDGRGHGSRAERAADPAAGKLPGHALGYYSGLISQRPHGAGSLGQIMSDYLGAPVSVEGCAGTWQRVPAADRTRLGQRAAALGVDCLLGDLFWDRQTTLRLRVGPLRGARFDTLLPKANGSGLLDGAVELARFLTGLALDLRIRLTVAASDVPPLQPTSDTGAPRRPRLGWNTWLAGRRGTDAAEECEFQFSATGGQSWR